jgi:hypothetical protein
MRSTSIAIASTVCSIRCSCSATVGETAAAGPLRSSRLPNARASGQPMIITAHITKKPIAMSTACGGITGP